MSIRLQQLSVRGFKSIRELNAFQPRPLNVFIGANGAGKSNFIGFFRLLSYMLRSDGRLAEYVGTQGGASRLLHEGPRVTRELAAELHLLTESGLNEYRFTLAHAAGDRLIFTDEATRFSRRTFREKNRWIELGAGHAEAQLIFQRDNPTTTTVRNLLRMLSVYQFHDTSAYSELRNKWSTGENRYLKENGGNLGSFLLRLQREHPAHYSRILRLIQTSLPFFDDFDLDDEHGSVLLRWREKGSDVVFDASQASDGMLRFIALVALLAQPPDNLPAVLFIDEPELGLHPSAIGVVAGLIRSASAHAQVFVSTQSVNLVNEFGADDVVVVNRRDRESTYERLDPTRLSEWLDEYSLGELWEKNVLGGKP